MTDEQDMKEIINLIDRLLAGEAVSPAELRDDKQAGLLELAVELNKGRATPTTAFETVLDSRLASLDTESRKPASNKKQRWLPGWLTIPRIGIAAAILVIALSLAGLTGAIIRGGYQGQTADSNVVNEAVAPDTGVQTLESSADNPAADGAGDSLASESARNAGIDSTGGDSSSPASSGSAAIPPLPSDQRVIQTAAYVIELSQGDFDGKYAQLNAIAGKYGGYVVSANTRSDNNGLKHGSITIRVANVNDNFLKSQADIDELGNVTSKTISGQDVTEEYIDLQSRLRSAEAQETQMLELMKKAQSIDDILTIQSRLAEIQSQIEQIKGRMQYVESRTDFATITVEMREAGDDTGGQAGDSDWGFTESLRYAGWLAVQTLNFVIMALGIILPLMMIVIIIYFLASHVLRWRHGRKNTGA